MGTATDSFGLPLERTTRESGGCVARSAAMKAQLIGFSLSRELEASVREALPRSATFAGVQSLGLLRTELERAHNAVVILNVPEDRTAASERSRTDSLLEFRETPVIALFSPLRSDPHFVMELGRLRIAELVTLTPRLPFVPFRAAVERCLSASVAQLLEAATSIDSPEVVRDALRLILRSRNCVLTVADLASLMGLHERTLRKRFDREQLPNPQWFVGWARLLLAAWMLADGTRSVTDVALTLEYSSPSSFRGTFKRYTGVTVSEARDTGAVALVANGMRETFAPGGKLVQVGA